MLFDTHAHLNDERFEEDRESLISSFKENGISYVCEIGYDLESSKRALELSEKYDFIYAVLGVHPHDSSKLTDKGLMELEKMLSHEKAVALGEIGLDYYYDNSERDVQRYWFAQQAELAKSLKCPISVHTRDAMEDTLNILKAHGGGDGIIHCYSGSVESAKILLNMGYYISFAGPVTFKNANTALDVIRYVPNDRMLIETDSPYLAPVPHRGKRNCPHYVREVAAKIAEIKGMAFEEVAEITTKNAKKVYRIE